MHRIAALAVLFAASTASALAPLVVLDVAEIGDPGNPADSLNNCWNGNCGAVADTFWMGAFEITNAQYAAFLNAVADADPNGLYKGEMATSARGGITRSGNSGSYGYSLKAGHELKPVVFVTFLDAIRFANWLHNGEPIGAQGPSTTEDGAYTITPGGIAANTIARNPGALFFVPNESEWFKAGYYDPTTDAYWDYPMGIDTFPTSAPPPGDATSANFWSGTYALTGSATFVDSFDYLTDVGSYPAATSPFGTYDQGGNAWEWVETVSNNPNNRTVRGGGWDDQSGYLSASVFSDGSLTYYAHDCTFRIATIVPEPAAAAAGGVALACLAARRRVRAACARGSRA